MNSEGVGVPFSKYLSFSETFSNREQHSEIACKAKFAERPFHALQEITSVLVLIYKHS